MKMVYHLSHTDLDGYGCQIVAKKFFENINFYNSGYGNEISERISEIFSDIDKEDFKENTILITDINLTLAQCKLIEENIQKCEKDIDILLLDHHKSGQECADKYKWYHLDISKCATKITFEYFNFLYGGADELEKFVSVVNAIDIWLKKDKYFELGKVFMKLISDAKEINRIMFPKENTDFIFGMLEDAKKYIEKNNANISLDDNLHKIKKNFFRQKESNDTLDNLSSKYVVKLLSSKKEQMSIFYKGAKGILTYSIGNVSVVGNDFLAKNPDFDFFMNITSRKSISLRANGKVDVSIMAKELANGGGHPNASGGMLNTFKDSFLYDNIKAQVENAIQSAEKGDLQ